MEYNIYIEAYNGTFNLFCLTREHVEKIASMYKKGQEKINLKYREYPFGKIHAISIITNEKMIPENGLQMAAKERGVKTVHGSVLNRKQLLEIGKDVTADFLEDREFGYEAIVQIEKTKAASDYYINLGRIEELKNLRSADFDLTKLIQLCVELNSNWSDKNFFTVGLLARTIINHVPPIFDLNFATFDQVVGGYGAKSFKGSMDQLNKSMRNIADGYTHRLISGKEPLPNEQQVDYRSNLDVLLAEIVKKLATSP